MFYTDANPYVFADLYKLYIYCLVHRMMIRKTVIALSCLLIFSIGCARTKELSELHKLPQGTNYYGGSFLYDPWLYMGSTSEYHYFRYTYPKGNALKTIDFRISQKELELKFECQYSTKINEWIAVAPIRSDKQYVVGFERTISIFDRDLSPNLKVIE